MKQDLNQNRHAVPPARIPCPECADVVAEKPFTVFSYAFCKRCAGEGFIREWTWR